MSLQPDSILNHYRVVRLLGSGGMGEVYLAEDTRLHRNVALKVLPPAMVADAQCRERFQREATAIASLNHPGIVTIYSVEEVDGLPFLTMELVEGRVLTACIPAHGMPLPRLLKLALAIVDAIHAAHQRGITHRDLKPSNILVTADDRVKVLDFGLAKFLARDDGPAASLAAVTVENITVAGHIVGTAAFMSPEQAKGGAVDHRTDIFSLGVLLYEMSTGDRPFKGESAIATISSVLHDTPLSVSEVNPTLPAELGRIVRRALMKEPQRRYQSAGDLWNDLVELKESADSGGLTNVPAAPARHSPMRRAMIAGAAAIAAIAIGWTARHAAPVADRPDRLDISVSQVTSAPHAEYYPSLSPDGRWVVYAADLSDSNTDILLQGVGGQTAINLTGDSLGLDTQPAFSPDGERIAFRSDRDGGGLFVMGRTGESVTRLTRQGYNPAWSPDATQIAYGTEPAIDAPSRALTSHLFVVETRTGVERLLVDGDGVQPAWSPHGQRIAYWSVNSATRQRDVWTVAASGGTPIAVTADAPMDWNPVWAVDGRHLYFISDRSGSMNLWQVAIEESTGRVLSTPQPVTIPAATMAHLSLSADGTRMAFSNHGVRSTIERVAFDAKSGTSSDVPVPVTNSTRDWSGPSFSPDAQWIAFSSGLPREDVYVSRVDGSGLRQLTNDQPFDRFAQWAPDGSRILFYSNRGGSQQEWTIRPDGSDLRQVSNYPGTGVVGARWSADGLRIAGESQSEKRSVIFDLQKPLEHRAVDKIAVTPAGETCTGSPSFSPEGTRIACGFCARSTQDCEPNLAIYSLADKTFERFPVAGTAPVWLRDGRRLLFVEHGNLRLLDTVSKHVVKLLSVTPNWLGTFSISRDETQIALTRIAEQGDIYLLTFKSQP